MDEREPPVKFIGREPARRVSDWERLTGRDQPEPSGATLNPIYHKQEQDIVGVPVFEIKDAKASSIEENIQIVAGISFVSGGFFLGVERIVTVGWGDDLVLVCACMMVLGLGTAFAGWRQAHRRKTRLERYLPDNISQLP